MKRLHVAVGLIALGAVCSLVGCKESFKGGGGGYQPKPFAGPGDSPVVVRGGAMTVRTKDSVGWKGASVPFCTGIGLTGGTLYFNYEGLDAVPGSPTPPPVPFPVIPKGSVALTGNNWQLTILGRNYVPNTTPSQSRYGNGIVITPAASCTGATGASVYVQLALTGKYPGFYNSDLNEKGTRAGKRFRDFTPLGTPGTNCFGPNSNSVPPSTGDEDVCERASLVTLNTGGGTTYSGWCSNGECVIGLGDIEK